MGEEKPNQVGNAIKIFNIPKIITHLPKPPPNGQTLAPLPVGEGRGEGAKALSLPPLTDLPGETKTISPDEPFVQILDPATGTATFLVEVIDVIHRYLKDLWKNCGAAAMPSFSSFIPQPSSFEIFWNAYVPKYLLPRLHGYELMMAPYAIAHMKMGLKLAETGYHFAGESRVQIYLTNALEPWVKQLPLIGFDALAHEAEAVNEIKRHKRFTVVIGNPPYSVTSANFNPFIDGLMDDYKKHVRGEQGLVALADDYLKFVRLSQKILVAPGCGVWGMITNHGYLKGVIHRGMRKELLGQFNSMFILDLHGDSNIGERVPAGRGNENVFDIQQGVAVSIAVRPFGKPTLSVVRHSDSWGSRTEKYNDLASHPISLRKWTDLRPVEPRYFLIPFDDAYLAEYEDFPSLNELMAVNSCGVKTHRDGIVIDYDKATLVARMSDIASEHRLDLLQERYGITDTPNWKLKDAQHKIKANEVSQFIKRLTYRPFDDRWIYYNPAIIEKGDSKYPTLRHMLHSNLALLSARIQATGIFDAVFVSKFLVEMKTAESSRSCTVFPLYLTDDGKSVQAEFSNDGPRPNLNSKILLSWSAMLGVKPEGNFGLPVGLTPEDIFHYIYAVFHSPGYRTRYAEFLKIDFPRLPLTGNLELFRELSRLGGELVALHLLESAEVSNVAAVYDRRANAWRFDSSDGHRPPLQLECIGPEAPVVSKPGWLGGTVWLDAGGKKAATTPGSAGFRGVPENVWNFHIGGYQVCEKWLKDRKGRTLTADDIAHYHKIVVALSETIRLMAEIEQVIETHGGWPGAFQTTAEDKD
jgi:predicted helicase